jgi:methylated-DNA-[protein]-cysteine S-methyltransferase
LGLVPVVHVRYAVEGWGVGELWLDGTLLVGHDLPRPGVSLFDGGHDHDPNGPQGIPEIPEISVAGESSRLCADIVSSLVGRFRDALAGRDVRFDDVELDLDGATPFTREAVATLRATRRGEVVTYGELAALAGRPGAARAAGSVCAQNRFSLVVPCHRVVAAGAIGGYGSLGVGVKRRLLALEGVHL